MAKSKESREEEFYRGQIRQLKAENKSLKRRIKELEKRKHLYNERDLDEVSEFQEELKLESCPDCTRGTLREVLILDRMFKVCDVCKYRTKAVKI